MDNITLTDVVEAVWLTPEEARRKWPFKINEIAILAEDLGFDQWAEAIYRLPSWQGRLHRRQKQAHLEAQASRKNSVYDRDRPEPPPAWTPEYAVWRSKDN